MSWTEDLANSVKDALQRKTPCRIAVHTQAQLELGQRSAQRLAPQYGAYAGDVEFELIPEDMQDTYAVGMIIV